MPGRVSDNDHQTPRPSRHMSFSPSPDPFLPSTPYNTRARTKTKRTDRYANDQDDGKMHERGYGHSNTIASASKQGSHRSPIFTRSQSRSLAGGNRSGNSSLAVSPAYSRSGSVTPRQGRLKTNLAYRQSPGMAALDELLEDEQEGEEEDDGYESPTKRLSDYDDESTVSWLIERQLKENEFMLQPPQPLVHDVQANYHGASVSGEREKQLAVPASSRQEVPAVDKEASHLSLAAKLLPEKKKQEPQFAEARPEPTKATSAFHPATESKPTAPSPFSTIRVVITALSALVLSIGLLLYPDTFRAIPEYVCTRLRLPSPTYHYPPLNPHHINTTYLDTLSRLSSELDRRLSYLSKDVVNLKDEWSRKLPLLGEVKDALAAREAVVDPLAIPKVNFLSSGMGARVDHLMTSPTKRTSGSLLRRTLGSLVANQGDHGPEAVLEPWEDAGDAWCSPMSHNGIQVAIDLGHAIVPQEVIVEHIPKAATLSPESAPKQMEMWVQYVFQPQGLDSSSSLQRQEPPKPLLGEIIYNHQTGKQHKQPHPSPSSPYSAAEAIFNTLQMTFPGDDPSTYTNDPLLGPSFFRVAKWEYDINGRYHIQSFGVNGMIDIPRVRAVRAVFRVLNTWGASDVCLYRLRLHGYT